MQIHCPVTPSRQGSDILDKWLTWREPVAKPLRKRLFPASSGERVRPATLASHRLPTRTLPAWMRPGSRPRPGSPFAAGPISRIGYQILAEGPRLARAQKGKVRLVVGINAGHQLDVGAVVIREAAVPGVAELVIAPGPLLLAGSNVVVGNVHDSRCGRVVVAAEEILARCPVIM